LPSSISSFHVSALSPNVGEILAIFAKIEPRRLLHWIDPSIDSAEDKSRRTLIFIALKSSLNSHPSNLLPGWQLTSHGCHLIF